MRELTGIKVHAISGGNFQEVVFMLMVATTVGVLFFKRYKLQDGEIKLAKYQALYGKLPSENALNNEINL